MPGSSLWLVPPPNSPISKTLTTLIHETVPSHFPSINPPKFAPHITLTSNLPDTLPDAQEWLDGLNFPEEVKVTFEALDVGDVFFKKMTIRVRKDSEGLVDLAVECRAKGVEDGNVGKAREWVRGSYEPHCSLLYADIEIPGEKKAAVEKAIRDAGISLAGECEMGGWEGGEVWLVATYKDIKDWKPVAKRKL